MLHVYLADRHEIFTRHVLEGAQYVYEGSHSVNQEHLKLTPTTQIVTIPSGKLGVASNAGVYEVLAPGRHVLNGPQYTFHGSESVKLSDVELGPNVRIITVEQGHLGLSENQGQFSILAPGRHALIGTTFSYLGQKKCSQVVSDDSFLTQVDTDSLDCRWNWDQSRLSRSLAVSLAFPSIKESLFFLSQASTCCRMLATSLRKWWILPKRCVVRIRSQSMFLTDDCLGCAVHRSWS